MKANQIPKRAEGWIFQGSAGDFIVWYADKGDYRVTDGVRGGVIGTFNSHELAYADARRLNSVRRFFNA